MARRFRVTLLEALAKALLAALVLAAVLVALFALAGCAQEELRGMRARMGKHEYDCELTRDVHRKALAQGRKEYAERAREIAAELGCPIQ